MKGTILIVDDVEINREMLYEIFKDEYDILCAADGDEAINVISENLYKISIVLLDVFMPKKDGFEVMTLMKKNNWTARIPIILITGDDSAETEKRGYEFGISDMIRKPFDAHIVKQRVKNVIDLYDHKNHLEDKVKDQTEILRRQNEILQKQAEQLKENNFRIIETMSSIVEFRNLESGEHIKRIKSFTRVMAEYIGKFYPEYNLTKEKIDIITSASALHDIGKIAIPDSILLKPARLTDDEFDVMKSHTTRGCEIIDVISELQDEEHYKASYNICRHHHERYDGRGYPDKLKGDDIPIEAQIVSIADVYDALVSERVYKRAYTKDEAYEMILRDECGVFDPKLIEGLKYVREQYEELADKMK